MSEPTTRRLATLVQEHEETLHAVSDLRRMADNAMAETDAEFAQLAEEIAKFRMIIVSRFQALIREQVELLRRLDGDRHLAEVIEEPEERNPVTDWQEKRTQGRISSILLGKSEPQEER